MVSTERFELVKLLKLASSSRHTGDYKCSLGQENPKLSPLKLTGKQVRLSLPNSPRPRLPKRQENASPSKTFTNFFVKQALQSRNRSIEQAPKTELGAGGFKFEIGGNQENSIPSFGLRPVNCRNI